MPHLSHGVYAEAEDMQPSVLVADVTECEAWKLARRQEDMWAYSRPVTGDAIYLRMCLDSVLWCSPSISSCAHPGCVGIAFAEMQQMLI